MTDDDLLSESGPPEAHRRGHSTTSRFVSRRRGTMLTTEPSRDVPDAAEETGEAGPSTSVPVNGEDGNVDVDHDDEDDAFHQRFEHLSMRLDHGGFRDMAAGESDSDDDEVDNEARDALRGMDYYMPLGHAAAADDDDDEAENPRDEGQTTTDGLSYERIPSSRAPVYMLPEGVEPMTDDEASKIRTLMAGIQIPPEAHPAWSRVVAEQDWMPRILVRSERSTTTSGPFRRRENQ